MAAGTSITSSGTSRSPLEAGLWAGLIGPPVIWLLQFQLRYSLVPWCCASGKLAPLWILSGAAVVATVAFGLISSWCWTLRRHTSPDAGERERRQRFMALLGLMTGVLFLLLNVAQAIPTLFLNPCEQ
jgi:hypothetical protein